MHFAKSDNVERWLTAVSASWKYRDSIPIAKLNHGWADQNPCRPGRAITEESLVYAERMQNGELAPPAIVVKAATGYVLLDGRQRVFGAQTVGASVFSAYEVIAPSSRLEALIAIGANQALNGKRPPMEFVIDAALRFMESQNATPKEAAIIAGVRVETILQYLATRKVRDALLANGIEPELSNGSLAALETFLSEPQVLSKTYLSIEKAAATVPMTQALVADMQKQPGKGRLIALERWNQRPEILARIACRQGRKMRSKQVFFQQLRGLDTCLKDRYDDIAIEMNDADRKTTEKIRNSVNSKMRQLAGEFAAAHH